MDRIDLKMDWFQIEICLVPNLANAETEKKKERRRNFDQDDRTRDWSIVEMAASGVRLRVERERRGERKWRQGCANDRRGSGVGGKVCGQHTEWRRRKKPGRAERSPAGCEWVREEIEKNRNSFKLNMISIILYFMM